MGDAACRHEEQARIEDNRAKLRRQLMEILPYRGEVLVHCVCGNRISLMYAYRCFYCGLYFCRACAGKHFE